MKYRREIDGLRALAVIPVILFHAGVPAFKGGFVGVDVFFVISGYLITSVIIAEKEAGTFSLVNFYERRMRRILPALFLMMAVCIPFAWRWLLPAEMREFSESITTVSLFVSNIFFLHRVGYFDTSVELKPLIHTWSLAVEEQFYVLFPLFLMWAWKWGKKRIIAILAVLAVISLAGAQWGAYYRPEATFYLLPSRAWELIIGAFIAFYFSGHPDGVSCNRLVRQCAGLTGLALILYAAVSFDKGTPFPSLYGLVPTFGAALIIIFSSPDTWAGKLLGSRPFVAIGLISYSAYLWHQPIFAFARYRCLTEPGLPMMLALSCGSLVLAYFSWRFVEQPFRRKGLISRTRIFKFVIIASAVFITFGTAGLSYNGFQFRFGKNSAMAQDFSPNKLETYCRGGHHYHRNKWYIKPCIIGDKNTKSAPSVAIFGDSHAQALLPAFDALGKKYHEAVVFMGFGGCPPLLGADVMKGNFDIGACDELSRKQYAYVKKNNIKKVFLVARWSLYTDGEYDTRMTKFFLVSKNNRTLSETGSRKVFIRTLEATVRAYKKLGAQVFVVLQIPQQSANPKYLYARIQANGITGTREAAEEVRKFSIPLDKNLGLQSFERAEFKKLTDKKMIKVVDLDSFFCKASICLMGNKSESYYLDRNHLNTNGAMRVMSGLERYFK